LLSQADSFLNRDLGRDIIHVQKLDRGQTQNTPVDHRKPLQPPVIQRSIEETIHL